MTRQARDITTKMKSDVFGEAKQKTNPYDQRTIFENVPVEDLTKDKYKDSIIIYNKNNLNEELDKIILHHKCIPHGKQIRTYNMAVVGITIKPSKESKNKFLKQNLLLEVDPNDTEKITYKDIQGYCVKHGVEFRNQSFGSLIKELRTRFYDKKTKKTHLHTTRESKDTRRLRGQMQHVQEGSANKGHAHRSHPSIG